MRNTTYEEKLTFLAAIKQEIAPKVKELWNDKLVPHSQLENSPEQYGKDVNRFVVIGQPVEACPMIPLHVCNGGMTLPRTGTTRIGKNWTI